MKSTDLEDIYRLCRFLSEPYGADCDPFDSSRRKIKVHFVEHHCGKVSPNPLIGRRHEPDIRFLQLFPIQSRVDNRTCDVRMPKKARYCGRVRPSQNPRL